VLPTTDICHSKPEARTNVVRIRPLPGCHYSPSFLKFCKRARFASGEEALSQVKDRSVAYALVTELT
jgi:hypothetical protein